MTAYLLTAALEHHRSGNLLQAEQIYRQILAADSSSAEAWYYLGSILQTQGKLDDAATALRRALQLRPDHPEALNNLGCVLARQKQFDEAERHLERACRLRPDWTEVCRNLGMILADQGKLHRAAECYRRIVQSSPRDPEPYNLLGSVLAREGQVAEAVTCFEEALRLEPRYATAHSNLLLALNYDPQADPLWLYAEHRFWDRLHGQGLARRPPLARDPRPDRPLRVGYVSPDFRAHAAAAFIEPILAHHDPSQVETILYAEVNSPDATSDRMRSVVRLWRSTMGLSDLEVADQVRADQVDIFVDLAGHSGRNRLGVFTHKPAPVQVTYLGYPNTTGLATIDYRITDAVADPPGEPKRVAEELVRLEGCFCCYRPPEDSPPVSPPPALNRGYVTFGSLHNLAKLNDQVLDLWCEILRRVPAARLFVFRNTLRDGTEQRLRQRLLARGIADDRFLLSHQPDPEGVYLSVYQQVDILLDTFPWSGHATTCESLWMGVPVVTLCGNRHAGRMSASILHCVGLHDWVAQTAGEYLQVAARAADGLEQLAELRAKLRHSMRNSPLCDATAFVRRLEAAYRAMWRKAAESALA